MAKGKSKPGRQGLQGLQGLQASPTHLLHRALQLALDFHAEAAGTQAITQRQFTVLAAAGEADGCTQNDLVRSTGIDRSTLADLVARLLAKGLLLRERSAADARAKTVRLSDAGRAALQGGAQAAGEADARLLALLSPKKRDALMKLLATLAAVADTPLALRAAKPKAAKPAPKAPKLKAPKVKAPKPKAPKPKATKAKAAEPKTPKRTAAKSEAARPKGARAEGEKKPKPAKAGKKARLKPSVVDEAA